MELIKMINLKKYLSELSQFDFKQLDFKEVGEWPSSVRFIFSVMFISLILSLGYFLQFKKMENLLKLEAAKEKTLYSKVENKIYETSHLNAYKLQIKEMNESFTDEAEKLPATIEMSGLIKDITKSGLQYGLEFDKIVLIEENSASFYIELPIEITARGTYHAFGQFLNDLTQLSRIITVHNFTVTPSAKFNELLELNVLIKTYKYNPDAKNNIEKETNKKKG
jgi:type IV pilus assembly protein PilO